MRQQDGSARPRTGCAGLAPPGHDAYCFCICVTHPFSDAGRFEGEEPDAPFTIRGSYLGRREFNETFERDGLQVSFHSWCYPLEDYARALEEAGFLVERLREPAASPEAAARQARERRRQRVPMFLHLRAVKDRSLRGSPPPPA